MAHTLRLARIINSTEEKKRNFNSPPPLTSKAGEGSVEISFWKRYLTDGYSPLGVSVWFSLPLVTEKFAGLDCFAGFLTISFV
jgi:hypothetical protein